MNEKIARIIFQMAEKAAYKSVDNSSCIGAYEIKPPAELLKRKSNTKKNL